MTSGTPNLPDLQRWMLSVVTHPEGVEAGIEAPATRGFVDVAADDVERVVLPSQKLDALSRLKVYGSSYFARLLECLRSEFTALVSILGEETFDAFGFEYLRTYPPHSYTLGQLGANFPKFLRENQPAEDLASETPTWSHLLVDLARLERLYSEVFDGPGTEGGEHLRPEDLQSIPPEVWPECRLRPVPCLRLEAFDFPVHEYRSAVSNEDDPVPPGPEPTFLVVTRRDYVVRRTAVPEDEFTTLRALVNGATVGEAIAAFAESSPLPDEEIAARIRDWFANWSAAPYFVAVDQPSR